MCGLLSSDKSASGFTPPQYSIFQINTNVVLFDGVCEQTKELIYYSDPKPDDVQWIISSSGHYMFVRFYGKDISDSSTGFHAKIHYGKGTCILNKIYST